MANGALEDVDKAVENYDFVRFSFADIHGINRSRTVAQTSVRKCFQDGAPMYIGAMGFGICGEFEHISVVHENHPLVDKKFAMGNVKAMPVAGTLHPLPAAGAGHYRVGEVLCETVYAWNNVKQPECPRYIAGRELDKLEALGFELYSSCELEFFLLDKSTNEPVFNRNSYMFSSLLFTKFENVLLEMAESLDKMGVHTEFVQTEYAEGQFELVLAPQVGMKTADDIFLTKDCIKVVADKHGYKAAFMTRPLNVHYSNGAHFNHSLKRKGTGENAFSDTSRPDLLSEDFHYWMGGLVRHFPALNALCSPTPNCYGRLRKPLAPNCSNWGVEDRLAAYRVKTESPAVTYIESRLPSGSSNPYLVMASTVAAGLDGLTNKILPPPPTSVSGDVDAKRYGEIESVQAPDKLEDGLESLKSDLYMKQSLGDSFIQWYAMAKECELAYIEKHVNNEKEGKDLMSIEREMYLHLL